MRLLSKAVQASRAWRNFAVLAALAATACTPGSQIPNDAAAPAACIVDGTTFAGWFKNGNIETDGEVLPADSLHFQTLNGPVCDFYAWSEQMFLWLNSPTPASYGGGGGRIFNSPAFFAVSTPDISSGHIVRTLIANLPGSNHLAFLRDSQVGANGFPILRDKSGKFFELAPTPLGPSGRQMIQDRSGKLVEVDRATLGPGGVAVFFDKSGQAIALPTSAAPSAQRSAVGAIAAVVVHKFTFGHNTIIVDPIGNTVDIEQGQAGGDVLMAQNLSPVYYTIAVNDIYAYFETGLQATGPFAIPNSPNKTFPTDQAGLDEITNFATHHDSSLTFPDTRALTVEVKAAWVEAVNLPPGCSYITMQASIPTYTPGSTQWTNNGQRTATLALVGMHVVGSVANHNEMIWATFEHVCNAPNAGYSYDSQFNGTKTGPVGTGPWLFSASDAPIPFNQPHMHYTDTAVPPTIDAYPSFTISPSDTKRMMPWGFPGSSSANNSGVLAINYAVRSQLPTDDARVNYIMTGATWTKGGVGAPVFGAPSLENTTMETYQQSTDGTTDPGGNCFSCHNGAPLGDSSGNGLSHIFGVLKPLF